MDHRHEITKNVKVMNPNVARATEPMNPNSGTNDLDLTMLTCK